MSTAARSSSESATAHSHGESCNAPDVPPFNAGFFSRDKATAQARTAYLKALVPGTILVFLAIWGVLSIYWGSFWRVAAEIHRLNVWVVDFDGGLIGRNVSVALEAMTGPKDMLTFQIHPASEFPGGPSDLAEHVHLERCWAGVSINPGATNTLMNAVTVANASYNGSLAMTIFVEEARNENSYYQFLGPLTFAMNFTTELVGSQNLGTLVADAPQIILQPLSFIIDNLRPFDIPVGAAIDFIGLIYLLILAFIAVLINENARTVLSGFERRLMLRSLIYVRLTVPVITYFFLSLSYSVLSLAFKVPFDRRFGRSGFVIYWMLSWCAMMALGLAVEAVITLVGTRYVPFFLILWIICQAAVSFYPIELLPQIYFYGYATPFYNVSRAVRTILFGTKNDVGLNFGILIAWIGVSLMTVFLFQAWARWWELRAWQQEREEAKQA